MVMEICEADYCVCGSYYCLVYPVAAASLSTVLLVSSSGRPPLPTTLALSHVKTTSILLGIYSTFVMSDHHKRPQNPLVEFVNSGS